MPDMERFLRGSFAPVAEEITAFDLPVTGQVPAELSGRYLRNGPTPIGLEDTGRRWFLGPGMVHGVRLRDGRAEWYRNRWVRARDVAGKLGEAWPRGPVHEGFDFAAKTHVIAHAGRTLATVEAGPLPDELSGELDTVGACDFRGTLRGGYAAHTKLDPRTGELHAIAHLRSWNHVRHVVVDAAGQVSGWTDIPVAGAPMMHDFALTEKYVVLYDLPVALDMDAVSAAVRMLYAWNPSHPARIGLLPRDGSGGIRWLDIDPCWVFHTLNAYDDGARVVVDLCQYSDAFDVWSLWAWHGPATLDRWIIDPAVGKVTQQRLDERGQEFPRVDERLVTRQHRYGYSVMIGEISRATVKADGNFADEASANAVFKHDLTQGTVEMHEFGRDATPGEAVFAPAAADADEDEGYVMAFVHNPERGAADLVILAAQDFTSDPVAYVHLPARIPLGFHGSWIAD